MLAEQKAALEEENKTLVASNAEIRQAIKDATNMRKLTHEEYETKVQELNQTVADVEECIEILENFANGEVALAQVKKANVVLA